MRPCFRVARREFSQEFAQHEEKFRQCAADRAKMIKTMTDSMADLAKRVRHCEERNSDIVQGIGELDAIISEEVSKWKVGRVRCAWGAHAYACWSNVVGSVGEGAGVVRRGEEDVCVQRQHPPTTHERPRFWVGSERRQQWRGRRRFHGCT